MYTIDLSVHPDRLERVVERARDRNIIIPTFAQMKNPALIPDHIKNELASIGLWDVHPGIYFVLPGTTSLLPKEVDLGM